MGSGLPALGRAGSERGAGARAGAATAGSAAGAVRQRERTEPEPCTRGPADGTAAIRENEEAAAGDAGVLALLAAPPAPGPRAPRVEAAFHGRLRRDASVERRALHELGGYYLVSPGRRAGGAGGGRAPTDLRAPRSPTPRAPSAAAPA